LAAKWIDEGLRSQEGRNRFRDTGRLIYFWNPLSCESETKIKENFRQLFILICFGKQREFVSHETFKNQFFMSQSRKSREDDEPQIKSHSPCLAVMFIYIHITQKLKKIYIHIILMGLLLIDFSYHRKMSPLPDTSRRHQPNSESDFIYKRSTHNSVDCCETLYDWAIVTQPCCGPMTP
jgi:hypothetical protein